MKKQLAALASALAALLFTGTLPAQTPVPILLNYQGRVVVGTTNFNSPPNGLFKFALVNAAGTTAYWSNDGTIIGPITPTSQPTAAVALTVAKGLCSAMLGDTTLANMTAIPASVFANADVRLRVWFNDGTNGSQLLTPDQRIAPGAYLADGAVTSAKIANGAVGNGQLAPNAVQATNIAAGAVDSTKIANVSIATGNLANGSVTAAKLGGDVGLWSAAGLNVYRNSGNVGIGVATPARLLDISGNGGSVELVMRDPRQAADLRAWRFSNANSVLAIEAVNDAVTGGQNVINFARNGNVGIGTTSPQAKLHVDGANGEHFYFSIPGHSSWNGGVYVDDSFRINEAGVASRLTIRSGGNIGIGTVNPDAALEVESSDATTTLFAHNSGGGSGNQPALRARVDAFSGARNIIQAEHGFGTAFLVRDDGRVGIGTTTPEKMLHVAGDGKFDGSLRVEGNVEVNTNLLLPQGRGLQFGNSALVTSGEGALLELRGTGFAEFIDFSNDLTSDFDMRLILVGDDMLQVEGGTLFVNGTTRTKVLEIIGGSDVAEPFAVSHPTKPEPGMVMTIDREHPGELCVATSAYARTVAGIISGANGVNPGLTLRQPGTAADGTYPVALSGRVYCWCDAAYGEIQPGDLLTTSDTPGHAMVATDFTRAPGATIGKAMTGLKDGKSLVLVLVTLQ